MSSQHKLGLMALLASASLAAALPLQAADAPLVRAERSTAVPFADLNLDQPGAAAALYQRLNAAADKVCGSRAFTSYYYTYSQYRSCVADALHRTIARIDHPVLNAYYQQQLQPARARRIAQQ